MNTVKIYKVVLRHSNTNQEVRHFADEKKADYIISEFEKKNPCKLANKYIVLVE